MPQNLIETWQVKKDAINNYHCSTFIHRLTFMFSMVNISVGTMIKFIPTGIEVNVVDDNHVEYQGGIYTISSFTSAFMPENKRNKSGAYQGSRYFGYKGKSLII